MSNTTFSWNIANLERTLATGEVTTVHYTVTAKDDAYSAGAYGSIGLEPADPDAMIPFAQLDEFTVASWVANQFGPEKIQEIEDALQQQINLKITPVSASGVPW